MGTQKLYDYVHDNPSVELRDWSFVNDTSVIRTQPQVTAINSAIEVDLTGRRVRRLKSAPRYSGFGGAGRLHRRGRVARRAASRSSPCPRRPKRGEESRIVASSAGRRGGDEPRPRALRGDRARRRVPVRKNLRQRAEALIAIAAPERREALARQVGGGAR